MHFLGDTQYKRAAVTKGKTVALEVAVILALGLEQLLWCFEWLMNAPEQMQRYLGSIYRSTEHSNAPRTRRAIT